MYLYNHRCIFWIERRRRRRRRLTRYVRYRKVVRTRYFGNFRTLGGRKGTDNLLQRPA